MHDLAIVGAGPAGISAAKAALAANLKTVLFEFDSDSFGGVCLNSGCIPTKFLIGNSKTKKSWGQLLTESQELIKKIRSPLLASLEKQGLDIIFGEVSFLDKSTLTVGQKKFSAKNIIIASGSVSKKMFQSTKVIGPQDLFSQPELADDILIIGAGYVGIELASLLKALGKKVTLIEKESQILPGFDSQLARRLQTILVKQGIEITTGVDATSAEGYNFDRFAMVIEAVGRRSNLSSLKIANAGIAVNENGWIKTNQQLKTSVGHIYACGDVRGGRLLAYTAEYQGRLCVKNITAKPEVEDYQGLPECVFSQPQLARVGLSEEQAKSQGINFKVIKSNFLKFSSSYVYQDTDGFIKVLIDDQEKIIGAGIISKQASELISIFSVCINNGLKLDDLKKCLFVHPTLSEILPLILQ